MYSSSQEGSATDETAPSPLASLVKTVTPSVLAGTKKQMQQTIDLYHQMLAGSISLGLDPEKLLIAQHKLPGTQQPPKQDKFGAKMLNTKTPEYQSLVVLRMLYLRAMSEVQTEINNAISQLQEHTANPKTDATLGKVGR